MDSQHTTDDEECPREEEECFAIEKFTHLQQDMDLQHTSDGEVESREWQDQGEPFTHSKDIVDSSHTSDEENEQDTRHSGRISS